MGVGTGLNEKWQNTTPSTRQRHHVPHCKTRENSNFLKKSKIVILIKIRNFSRSRMMKQTSSLESSREI